MGAECGMLGNVLVLASQSPRRAEILRQAGIPFTIRHLQQVNATRNTLVLSHVTGVPPNPPGYSRCSKCALQDQCAQVSELLDWLPPRLSEAEPSTDGDEEQDQWFP